MTVRDVVTFIRLTSALRDVRSVAITRASAGKRFGLHSIRIAAPLNGVEVTGRGAAFSEMEAYLRAWGEFVERATFHNVVARGIVEPPTTSSGFASHTSWERASLAAVAELVERDAFCCSWLLAQPATLIARASLERHLRARGVRRIIDDEGACLRYGVLGRCMGFVAGIVCIELREKFAIATAARPSLDSVLEQLTLEAVFVASGWLANEYPSAIETLPESVEPIDHQRYYLERGPRSDLAKALIVEGDEARELPEFEFQVRELTALAPLARCAGYEVAYASTRDAQRLWFGATGPEVVNLDRLSKVAGRRVSFGELRHAPHPLP